MKFPLLLIICADFLINVSNAHGQEFIIANNREEALSACQKKAQASPKELQKQMLRSCLCIVKHTDFKKASILKKSENSLAMQKLYDEAAKKCKPLSV